MSESPSPSTPSSGAPAESTRRRAARYAAVAAIVLVVGGIFVYRESTATPEEDTVEASRQIEVGEEAPDFTLDTPDGEFRLSDARGEIVVVNFWATWCGPCRFEMPEFQALHQERGEAEGIRVVAVNLTSADSREGALQYAQDFGLTFTIAFDDQGTVAEHYGVHSLPATFFIDREGIVRTRSYGPVLGDRLEAALVEAGANAAE
ncbi:MAG: TlpA family protein disulfide reductase [Dehalococcoidia bacterium]